MFDQLQLILASLLEFFLFKVPQDGWLLQKWEVPGTEERWWCCAFHRHCVDNAVDNLLARELNVNSLFTAQSFH